MLAQLFQPFQQADSSVQRTHGGTGLGLSIAKSLVDLWGGRIHAESKLGTRAAATARASLQRMRQMHPGAQASGHRSCSRGWRRWLTRLRPATR